MAKNYWEYENPLVIETTKNVLRYFPQAGKLQVSLPSWTNDKGEEQPGKTVTLDVESLQLSEDREKAIDILQSVLAELEAEEKGEQSA